MSDPTALPTTSATPLSPSPSLWHLGWRATRANLGPGIVLWLVGLAVVVGYTFVPTVHGWMIDLGDLKTRLGFRFSMVSTCLVGGLLPFAIQHLTGRVPPGRSLTRDLLFTVVFWSYKGIEIDLLYRVQAAIFGNDHHTSTVVLKVLADQFIYSLLWANPIYLMLHQWKDRDFQLSRVRYGRRFWRDGVLAVQLSSWVIWFPTVTLIYFLPLPLQLPIQNVVLVFWVLMLAYMSSEHNAQSDDVAGAQA